VDALTQTFVLVQQVEPHACAFGQQMPLMHLSTSSLQQLVPHRNWSGSQPVAGWAAPVGARTAVAAPPITLARASLSTCRRGIPVASAWDSSSKRLLPAMSILQSQPLGQYA
jgi:hypothetical protein